MQQPWRSIRGGDGGSGFAVRAYVNIQGKGGFLSTLCATPSTQPHREERQTERQREREREKEREREREREKEVCGNINYRMVEETQQRRRGRHGCKGRNGDARNDRRTRVIARMLNSCRGSVAKVTVKFSGQRWTYGIRYPYTVIQLIEIKRREIKRHES